tara:strand:+ start:808 stop:1053 length:246 start_codon:yes stop_codon:yes gene_type:complete
MSDEIKFFLRKEDDYIELYKLLKATNLVYSGAEAKQIISDGLIKVDGNIETRKRKKISSLQEVEIDKIKIKVHSNNSHYCK